MAGNSANPDASQAPPSSSIPKAYEPAEIEKRWAAAWVEEKLFHTPTPSASDTRPCFTLLLPPPNVTGRLHMGHMLNQTQMDIIVRWHRMRGDVTLWLPGTDHAGIATQMMVERQLASEGKKRQSMTREAFTERVWEWKRQFGGAITDQMKRLGASVDWDREYFTMDDNLSRAVREVFVRLYEAGLIYRGKYIVNWCPRCGTAISDLEVKHEDIAGKLYEIRYPIAGSGEFITVATTRPETMLGDAAIAVNEKDERYAHLRGKNAVLPLINREIPIIYDDLAQPEFGTGAVKVTPSHDPNDFEAGLRHNLPQIEVIDEQAKMNPAAGPYAGLERYEARSRIVADLEAQGFLVGVKDHTIPIGKCDRCGTNVEPRLSLQWFVKIKPLADRATEVVERGFIKFTPENYKQIYLNWMKNIHDWTISRQLWWGHRIPVWTCANCKEVTVARDTPHSCKCGSENLEQDTDVLDTWFSSALLPFTALGWPDATRDLEVFYPTSLLITGFDILFFWVARMIMMGCWFMSPPEKPGSMNETVQQGDSALQASVPFREVYIHALVRDAERQKMSKTKGNVMDPIEVIEKYGTDATRFTLASMSSPGTDIAFNSARTEGYRAFANKIWNAFRFMMMTMPPGVEPPYGVADFTDQTLEDKWILSRFNRVAREMDSALNEYRFDNFAQAIYGFFWGEFCDWYLELVKPRLNQATASAEQSLAAGKNLVVLFEGALRLLHPVMPFITEELWHALYAGQPPAQSIALASYPQADDAHIDLEAESNMAILQDLIVSVRNLRAEAKVETKAKTPVAVFTPDHTVQELITTNRGAVERLANVEEIKFSTAPISGSVFVRHTARFDVQLVYERKVDASVERARLGKDIDRMTKELANGDRQLSNESFLAKAPPQVVEGLRRRRTELGDLLRKAQNQLDGLK